jgi:hypothetical protein
MRKSTVGHTSKIRPCADENKTAQDAPCIEQRTNLSNACQAADNQPLLCLFATASLRGRCDLLKPLFAEFAGLYRRRAACAAIHPLSPRLELFAALGAFLRKEGQPIVPRFFDFCNHIANYTLWRGRWKAVVKTRYFDILGLLPQNISLI